MASISTLPIDLLVLGAGKVGLNVARLAASRRLAVRLWNPRPLDARRLALVRKLGLPLSISPTLPDLSLATQVLVAVPDPAVAPLLAQIPDLPDDCQTLLLVTSGFASLPDSIQGLRVVRFHPAFSFSRHRIPLHLLKKVCVLLSGPPEATDRGQGLVDTLGWHSVVAPDLDPLAYHAACVFASNLTSACLVAAAQLLSQVGIGTDDSSLLLRSLVAVPATDVGGTVDRPRISGPASRGDSETLIRELEWMAQKLPHLVELFRSGNKSLAGLADQQDVKERLDKWNPHPM